MGLDCIPLSRISRPYPPALHHLIHYGPQRYPGELVRSSGTDITLDNVLTILDEHYNNIKVLDALNQEFSNCKWQTRRLSQTGASCLSRHIQVLAALFPECFPPDCVAKLKHDCFYCRLPKHLKAMVAYLKASLQEKTYSDYLWAAREAEKEDSMELSQSPQIQATNNTTKLRQLVSSPCRSLKGPSQQLKHLPCAWHT